MQNSGPFRLKIGTVYENFKTDNGKEMLWAINIWFQIVNFVQGFTGLYLLYNSMQVVHMYMQNSKIMLQINFIRKEWKV